MQRQSLSSPGSKLHIHGGKEEKLDEEEQKRKDGGDVVVDDEEENKVEKIHHRKSTSRTEKSIHLIPILMIFCFLVLYLCSYDPPKKDLLHFNGFRKISKQIDSTGINDFERVLEIDKGDVLAIRSHRNLQEIERNAKKFHFHRKIGN